MIRKETGNAVRVERKGNRGERSDPLAWKQTFIHLLVVVGVLCLVDKEVVLCPGAYLEATESQQEKLFLAGNPQVFEMEVSFTQRPQITHWRCSSSGLIR